MRKTPEKRTTTVDTAPVDIVTKDGRRPRLTVVQDAYSRTIVGWTLD